LDEGNAYRQASAPYPSRGFSGRPAAAHRNRTLHLNASASASGSASSSAAPSPAPTTPGWVSKNDRHRQLINANIYEKESQNRAKAIEETRQRKIKEQRHREKKRFGEYLRRQAAADGFPGTSMSANSTVTNEISVNGIRFRVLDGGKKLVKAPGKFYDYPFYFVAVVINALLDDHTSPTMTPKMTVIAGVKFHRTKTGNLVAQRIVKDHRYVHVPKTIMMLTPTVDLVRSKNLINGAKSFQRPVIVSSILATTEQATVLRDAGVDGEAY
jgi:hypothetical protein